MKSLKDYVDQINDGTIKATLLGIGPMSKSVIEASLELAKTKKFPIMYIASRNQVDADEFGSGYVNKWDQHRFVADIRRVAEEIGFDGDYFICRDHGGPWQRDAERQSALPREEAMTIAKKSYAEDILAGFDLLHIDPTKIPGYKVAPLDQVIDMTVELIAFCEQQKAICKRENVVYEVGTEETNGGLTEADTFEQFMQELFARLEELGLPKPVFIVGQTGTLVKMTENVGSFNYESAERLSALAKKYGMGMKEHNCDYISFNDLCLHPVAGVTASNVAPEFGYAETCALLGLCQVEEELFARGLLSEKSELYHTLVQRAVESKRWVKWITRQMDEAEILQDHKLSEEIVHLAGHYTFNDAQVIEQREKLYDNLKSLGLNPQRIVLEEIKKSIDNYVVAFNMEGSSELK